MEATNNREPERTLQTGVRLICYGNECTIQELAMMNGSLYAKLSYSIVNRHKTGTDGWYHAGHLLRDDNVHFVDSDKTEEYNQVYRDLSNILFTLGGMREAGDGVNADENLTLLSDEELGRKIREFCTTYGSGGTISCEGLARIILTSTRSYFIEGDEPEFIPSML